MDFPDYRLIRDADGWELSGGSLDKELRYPDNDESIDAAKRIVGFLAQVTGAKLAVYGQGRIGLIETKVYAPGIRPAKSQLGNP